MAFHPYPQVIPPVFNLGGFGPPRGLTPASACPWIAHLASRLRPATLTPCSDSLSLRLAFQLNLAADRNSLAHSTKGTPSRARGPLRLLVGTRFQVLFHSPPGVLFTFPSRYLSTIGHRRVFRLGGWSPQVPTGFHVSGSTQVSDGSGRGFAYGALTLSRRPSQAVPLPRPFLTALCRILQPRRGLPSRRFGLCPRSLATTGGISVDFSSSGYLDVSVPQVTFARPMCSAGDDGKWLPPGSPIRRSTGQAGMCP